MVLGMLIKEFKDGIEDLQRTPQREINNKEKEIIETNEENEKEDLEIDE